MTEPISPVPTSPEIKAEIDADITVRLDHADRWTLVLRRPLRHAPERVWAMLTQPDRLARWSPVVPDRPLDVVGPASARENPGDDPVDAEVLVAEAPHLLVHRWGPAVLRWTVTAADDGGSVLELQHTFDDGGEASSYAAGWRVCLGTLAASHDGVERERVTGARALDYGWAALRDAYEAALDPAR